MCVQGRVLNVFSSLLLPLSTTSPTRVSAGRGSELRSNTRKNTWKTTRYWYGNSLTLSHSHSRVCVLFTSGRLLVTSQPFRTERA